MGPNFYSILIVAALILILFGRGRISEMMGDFGKGISSFKKGMSEDVEEKPASNGQIEAPAKDVNSAETTTKDSGDKAQS